MAATASSRPRNATTGWPMRWTWRHSPRTSSANPHHEVAKMPRRPIACIGGMVSAASLISASLKMKTTTDADIARMPRRLSITYSFSMAGGHLQDQLPVLVVDRHDRQPRLAHQLEVRELGIGLDGSE